MEFLGDFLDLLTVDSEPLKDGTENHDHRPKHYGPPATELLSNNGYKGNRQDSSQAIRRRHYSQKFRLERISLFPSRINAEHTKI
jgi:hypothetical protein